MFLQYFLKDHLSVIFINSYFEYGIPKLLFRLTRILSTAFPNIFVTLLFW